MVGEITYSTPPLAVGSLSIMPLPPPPEFSSVSLPTTNGSYRHAGQDLTRLLSGFGSRPVDHTSGTTPTCPAGHHGSSDRRGIEIVPYFMVQSWPDEEDADAYDGDRHLLIAKGRMIQSNLLHNRGLETVFRLLSSVGLKRILIAGMRGYHPDVIGIATVDEENARELSNSTGINDVRDGDALLVFSPNNMPTSDKGVLSTTIEHELWHPWQIRAYPERDRHLEDLREIIGNKILILNDVLNGLDHLFLRNEAWRHGRRKFVVRDVVECMKRKVTLFSFLLGDEMERNNFTFVPFLIALLVDSAYLYRSIGRVADASRIEKQISKAACDLADNYRIGRSSFDIARRHAADLYGKYFDAEGNPFDNYDMYAICEILTKMAADSLNAAGP